MKQLYPSSSSPQTLSRYLWDTWLSVPPTEKQNAVAYMRRYFGNHVGRWRPEYWLYTWAVGLLAGWLDLSEIPAQAHLTLEFYLRTPAIRQVVDRMVEETRG